MTGEEWKVQLVTDAGAQKSTLSAFRPSFVHVFGGSRLLS